MHVFIFLSLSITQAFHSFLSFLSFAPKIHGGGLQFLCLSPPWCLTPPLLWWGSTHPPWIGILARTIFAAIVNTPLSYYLWNFGTNDKFSPPPSNPGVENLSTWISDTWSSGTYMSQNSTCQKSTCWDSVLPPMERGGDDFPYQTFWASQFLEVLRFNLSKHMPKKSLNI